jgi:AraC-like DNA-binding protein
VFGDKVEFDAGLTCVRFDKSSLSRRLPNADATLHRELVRIAGKMAAAPIAPACMADRVRRHLAAAVAQGDATEQATADALCISVRSLQRGLADSGTTFTLLLEETRRNAARQLLIGTRIPLTEIAFKLGYSELSAFSRAARSWFGEPPSQVRKKALRPATASSD